MHFVTLLDSMEFTVIDAHVIRSNREDRGGQTDSENPEEIIGRFEEIRHLDLSCSSKLCPTRTDNDNAANPMYHV